MTEHSDYNLVVWTAANLQIICVIKDITWTQNVRTLIDLYLSVFIILHYITFHRNYLKSPMVKNC